MKLSQSVPDLGPSRSFLDPKKPEPTIKEIRQLRQQMESEVSDVLNRFADLGVVRVLELNIAIQPGPGPDYRYHYKVGSKLENPFNH